MLLHCRSAHKDELETIEAQKEKSTQKDALRQQDVSKMLQKSSVISYNSAKQKELNRAVVYNTVIHDEMPLTRFDSPGFRRSFELVSEGKFVLAKRKHASKITRSICDESELRIQLNDEIDGQEGLTPEVIGSLNFSNRLHANDISADTLNRGAVDAGCATTVISWAAAPGRPGRRAGSLGPPRQLRRIATLAGVQPLFLAGRRCKHVLFFGGLSLQARSVADDRGQARRCHGSGWQTVAETLFVMPRHCKAPPLLCTASAGGCHVSIVSNHWFGSHRP
jgi:hypothetical protein